MAVAFQDFRKAHAWLAGYDDALANRPNDPGDWSLYLEDYEKGFKSGWKRKTVTLAANR